MKPFQRGFDARNSDLPRSANPFPMQSDKAIAWDTGWTSADADAMVDDIERQQAHRMASGQDYGGTPVRRGIWGRINHASRD